jgi:hypothetical protein
MSADWMVRSNVMNGCLRQCRQPWSLAALIIVVWMIATVAHTQDAPPARPTAEAVPLLMQRMVGTWDVKQRMWPAAGALAIDLPAATARRRLIEGAFLEEIMTLASGVKADPFTRVSYMTSITISK